ncbi:anion permease [Sinomonas atrocyanea]|uniref:inorganic phosphate transporter n=1 Tax=Sinomonas atrocyanea TaxID=37927 RepID=UPI002859E19A|nr:anion permease [Sinomonas atrocyanea]MDR6621433.1 PiT family inorganic phosphate transporter [Sinomonas atrocyanea]
MAAALVGASIVLVCAFGFLNGFRDASNAVALTVRTRALTPGIAVVLTAAFNVLGTLAGAWLLRALGTVFVTVPAGSGGLTVLAATLVAAILWGVWGWWKGYPSSSTHALVGGLIGASIASAVLGGRVPGELDHVFWLAIGLPLILSPLLAFGAAFVLTPMVTWMVRYTQPSQAHAGLRAAQSVGAAVVAFGHGLQDGQRIVALLVISALGSGASFDHVPLWAAVLGSLVLGAGTLAGGWRITYTLSHRLIRMDPLRAFVSQLVTSTMLVIGSLGLHMPLSTTHTVVASVLGAGVNQDYASVNGPLVVRLIRFWLVTPLTTAALGLVFALAFAPLAGLG